MYLYSAFIVATIHSKRSGVDHTVLPANNTTPAFPSWRSPDVATTATAVHGFRCYDNMHVCKLTALLVGQMTAYFRGIFQMWIQASNLA